MTQIIHRLRLFFCTFSGEDDFIIRKCNAGIQISFAFIGLFVLFVFAGCWISASLFMSHIFDGARWISVPIGILWALLVTNLYLLLLYTISPILLPIALRKKIIKEGKVKKIIIEKKERHPLLTISLLFRIGLIILLAVIITQPFNVLIFAPSFEEADLYAKEIREILSKRPLSWFTTILGGVIFLLPVYFKYKVRAISNKNFLKDFTGEHAKKGILHLREQLGNSTDFENLSRQILSTDINSVRTSDFYFQKTLLEYRIILEEYVQFKQEYSSILIDKSKEYNRKYWERVMPYLNKLEINNPKKYQVLYKQMINELQVENIQRYEYWADPPFRTKHKSSKRKLATEAELLHSFYQDNS